nr:MAG TPA: hypothetical protein [Caudoviricetes sp.]
MFYFCSSFLFRFFQSSKKYLYDVKKTTKKAIDFCKKHVIAILHFFALFLTNFEKYDNQPTLIFDVF